jgi:hypothetical protein
MSDQDDASNDGCLGQAFFLLVVLVTLFESPAIIVLWPFSKDFMTACQTALSSVTAFVGSAIFWGLLFLVWRALQK